MAGKRKTEDRLDMNVVEARAPVLPAYPVTGWRAALRSNTTHQTPHYCVSV